MHEIVKYFMLTDIYSEVAVTSKIRLLYALFDAVAANHDGKIDEEEGRRFFADIGTHPDGVGYY